MGMTPISSLPYPELTGPNNPPADFEALANELDPLVKPQIQSYAVAWTQSGGSGLAIGNGTLEGKFVQTGRLVAYRILLVRGSTTNLGTATYQFSLPVAADTFQQAGGNSIMSVGGLFKQGAVRFSSSTTCAVMRPDDTGLGPSSFTWASGDWIAISGTYLAAV